MSTPPLVEDGFVPDVFVSGIGKIEKLNGGLVRLTYYAERRNDQGDMEHVVVLRTVRTAAAIGATMRQVARALAVDVPLVAGGGEQMDS